MFRPFEFDWNLNRCHRTSLPSCPLVLILPFFFLNLDITNTHPDFRIPIPISPEFLERLSLVLLFSIAIFYPGSWTPFQFSFPFMIHERFPSCLSAIIFLFPFCYPPLFPFQISLIPRTRFSLLLICLSMVPDFLERLSLPFKDIQIYPYHPFTNLSRYLPPYHTPYSFLTVTIP